MIPFKIEHKYAKHSFHVKELCGQCHKFQRFVKQDEKVIASLKNSVVLEDLYITKEVPFDGWADQETGEMMFE